MRGQIFVQDVGVSLAISLITILSLISYMNFTNAQFEQTARSVHEEAIMDRVAEKMFTTNEYEFNRGAFAVNSDFSKFVSSLNNEERYEQVRTEYGLTREGVSYDIQLVLMCNGSQISGGIKNDEALRKTILITMDDQVCTVDMWLSRR